MRPSTSTLGRRRRAVVLTGIVAGAVAAIGVPAAVSASTSPPAAGGDYCQAHLDLEAATSPGADPATIQPAIDAARDAVPAEIADALNTAIENAPTDGPPTPAFEEAYAQVVAWVKDNCDLNTIDVLAVEDHDADPTGVYTFGGLPAEVPAGPTVVSLTNEGEEVHELVLVRRAEGNTDPVQDLIDLAISGADLAGKIDFVNGVVAFPGETGSFITDLTPGNYIAVCFFPAGNTPEQMMAELAGSPSGSAAPGATSPAGTEAAAMTEPTGTMEMDHTGSAAPGSDGPIAGQPHAYYGMTQEFTVVDGAAPATTG